MKQLSVIIVNYNVRYFLELTLDAAYRACRNLDAEIIVVDNASSDGSEAYIRERFPKVEYIYSKENLGFSKGNNLGIERAKGEFILLLNPDTVVAEDNFEKALQFMAKHADCGALGVKMLDGSGAFLPESKRGLPTPAVAFYKLSGLSSLFPKSKKYGQYHLAYLNKDQNHSVDVLAGAYMLLRKEALHKCGLLDEHFFMYGEDIDLSYRINKSGYQCYYFSESPILHFKGESTKKTSVNYVRVFYQAMAIFAKKHFSSNSAKLLSLFIHIGIYLKAFLTIIRNFLQSSYIILLDAALGLGSMYLLKKLWAVNVMNNPRHFPPEFGYYIIPALVSIWLLISYLSGVYDKPYKLSKIVRGILTGTIISAAVYGFLPEEYRFSRMMIALGALSMMSLMIANRWLFNLIFRKKMFMDNDQINTVIVGERTEADRVLSLMNRYSSQNVFCGYVSPSPQINHDYIGRLDQLAVLVKAFDIDQIIFCAADVEYKNMIRLMEDWNGKLEFKIVLKSSDCILGSSNKNTAGEISAEDVNLKINLARSKRNKRLIDLSLALSFLLFFPLLFWPVKQKAGFLLNIFAVLSGQKTWVGFARIPDPNLPPLRSAVIPIAESDDQDLLRKANWHYARNYSVYKDLELIFSQFSEMGGNT